MFSLIHKVFISGKKTKHMYGSIMIKNMKVRTCFVTERAIFIHWMFSNSALGGQAAQRQQGGQAAVQGAMGTRKLRTAGWYGKNQKRIAD
jgi:hypothetical protein